MPLVPANPSTKKDAPTIQIPQQQGYSCEIASGAGCSPHPCVKYAQSVSEVAVTATATATAAAAAGRCNGTANAVPRAVPIVAP